MKFLCIIDGQLECNGRPVSSLYIVNADTESKAMEIISKEATRLYEKEYYSAMGRVVASIETLNELSEKVEVIKEIYK